MYGEFEGGTGRAVLREWARLGNLLSNLTHSVRGGALAGDPVDNKGEIGLTRRPSPRSVQGLPEAVSCQQS